MKTIFVVGIGTGSPEHMTIAGIEAINRADVLFVPDKGADKADLADVRLDIITRFVRRAEPRMIGYSVPSRDAGNPDYGQGVADWHAALAGIFGLLIADSRGTRVRSDQLTDVRQDFAEWSEPIIADYLHDAYAARVKRFVPGLL